MQPHIQYNLDMVPCYHFHAVMFHCVAYIILLHASKILSEHCHHICHHTAHFGHSGQLHMAKPVHSLLITAIKHTTLHNTT